MPKKVKNDPAIAGLLTDCQVSLVRVSRYATNLTNSGVKEAATAERKLTRLRQALEEFITAESI